MSQRCELFRADDPGFHEQFQPVGALTRCLRGSATTPRQRAVQSRANQPTLSQLMTNIAKTKPGTALVTHSATTTRGKTHWAIWQSKNAVEPFSQTSCIDGRRDGPTISRDVIYRGGPIRRTRRRKSSGLFQSVGETTACPEANCQALRSRSSYISNYWRRRVSGAVCVSS